MKQPPMTAPPMPSPAMPEGGDVNISIPKSDFDEIYGMLTQLVSVLDRFKSEIDAEEAAVESEMPAETAMPMEDADLAAFAAELNQRPV
jgi:hypothetical protein